MTIKAILFDIDGTLVDSNEQHVTAWDEAFRSVGKMFQRAAIHDQIGKGSDMLVPALMPGADQALCERLGAIQGDIYKSRFLRGVRAFPGARDLVLRASAAGQLVVLATSASREDLSHYIDLLDIRDVLSATTSADDVEHSKPAPDIFAAALRKIVPVEAHDAIVVGDSPYDAEAARKCRIRPVGVRSGGFTDEALRGAGAVALYDDVAALLADYEQSPLMN